MQATILLLVGYLSSFPPEGPAARKEREGIRDRLLYVAERAGHFDPKAGEERARLLDMGEKLLPVIHELLSRGSLNPKERSAILSFAIEIPGDHTRLLRQVVHSLTYKDGVGRSPDVRHSAAGFVKQIGTAAEASLMVALLSDHDTGIVLTASEALVHIGGPYEVAAMKIWLDGVSHRDHVYLRQRVRACRDALQKRLEAQDEWSKKNELKASLAAIQRLEDPTLDRRIILEAQYALDKSLFRSDAKWRRSEARRRFFEQWLEPSNFTNMSALYLGMRLSRGELDDDWYLRLIQHGLDQRRKYNQDQQGRLTTLLFRRTPPRTAEGRSAWFEFLVSLVKDDDGAGGVIQSAAACGLRKCLPLSPKEKETIGELRSAARHPDVVKHLDQILK